MLPLVSFIMKVTKYTIDANLCHYCSMQLARFENEHLVWFDTEQLVRFENEQLNCSIRKRTVQPNSYSIFSHLSRLLSYPSRFHTPPLT
jgi:hypothetical protein